ncbi:hypothetical protein F183_A26390 [Bryobacterales bacterium F-183]|nr:hypothetical protein F183_A26390 [Bryobacterales bacterium F-183]
MRLLLDECVDEDLRHSLTDHDCQTARYAQLAGLDDNQLLTAAEAKGFEVLITVDQHLPFQQNLEAGNLAIVVLCGRFARLSDLERLVPSLQSALAEIRPGRVVRVTQ